MNMHIVNSDRDTNINASMNTNVNTDMNTNMSTYMDNANNSHINFAAMNPAMGGFINASHSANTNNTQTNTINHDISNDIINEIESSLGPNNTNTNSRNNEGSSSNSSKKSKSKNKETSRCTSSSSSFSSSSSSSSSSSPPPSLTLEDLGRRDTDADRKAQRMQDDHMQEQYRAAREVERQKLKSILASMTEQERKRYDAYKGAKFKMKTIRKLLRELTGTSKMSTHLPPVVGELAKLFVGKVLEESRVVMGEQNEAGSIRPEHLREALERVRAQQGGGPGYGNRKREPLFRK